jgi:hypothetical protein
MEGFFYRLNGEFSRPTEAERESDPTFFRVGWNDWLTGLFVLPRICVGSDFLV